MENVNVKIETTSPPEQPFMEKEFVIRSSQKRIPIVIWSARERVDDISVVVAPYPPTTVVTKGDVVIKGDVGTAIIHKHNVASVIIALEKIIGD